MLKPRSIFRASMLDSFCEYLSGETFTGEEYTREMFVERLTNFKPTAKMEAGTAVHAVLEAAGADDIDVAEANGWKVQFVTDLLMSIPSLREIELQRTHGNATLYGRVDYITGTTVGDYKATSQFDADRYADSYQWRAYLWMSGRAKFDYHLLKVAVDEDARTVEVKDYITLNFFRYPSMDSDVERLLSRYAEVIEDLGIMSAA